MVAPECGLGEQHAMKAISAADGCECFVHVCCCCGSCDRAGEEHDRDECAFEGRHCHMSIPRCLSTPHSHVIDQFFGLEVALVVVLSVELGPGQPGES